MTPQVMLYQMFKLMKDERGGSEPSKEVEDILGKLPKDLVSLRCNLVMIKRPGEPLCLSDKCNRLSLSQTGALFIVMRHNFFSSFHSASHNKRLQ